LGELDDSLVYTSESITTLLAYKLGTVKHMQLFFFLLFFAYMVCVLTTKTVEVYIGWCVFHILIEIYQFCLLTSKLDYFKNVWNWTDLFRIISQVVYIYATIKGKTVFTEEEYETWSTHSLCDSAAGMEMIDECTEEDLYKESTMNFEIKAFGILTFTAWLSFIRQYRHLTALRKFIEIIVSIYASIGVYMMVLLTTCVMFITVKSNSMYYSFEI
jgi:hypothetical protein